MIEPLKKDSDSILLQQPHFELLAREGNYIKPLLNILGNDNGATRFLSTDTIKFSVYLKSEVVIDLNSSE